MCIQGVSTTRSLIEIVSLTWRDSILGIFILFHSHGDAIRCLIIHVVIWLKMALSDCISHILSSIKIYIIFSGCCCKVTANRVVLMAVLSTEIAILGVMHLTQVSIRISIWGLYKIIVCTHLVTNHVTIINVLWRWNRALNYINIGPFSRVSNPRFCCSIFYILVFKIVHAINIYSFRWQFFDGFADKTLISVLLFSCTLLRALIRKSTISRDI